MLKLCLTTKSWFIDAKLDELISDIYASSFTYPVFAYRCWPSVVVSRPSSPYRSRVLGRGTAQTSLLHLLSPPGIVAAPEAGTLCMKPRAWHLVVLFYLSCLRPLQCVSAFRLLPMHHGCECATRHVKLCGMTRLHAPIHEMLCLAGRTRAQDC